MEEILQTSALALALIAGAEAIEQSADETKTVAFLEQSITYREAAILLREQAQLILYTQSL